MNSMREDQNWLRPRGCGGRRALFVFCVLAMAGCRVPSATQNMNGVRDFQTGRYESAAQKFQMASLQNPANPNAYYNLATTLHQLAYVKGKQARTKEDDDEVRDLQVQAEAVYNRCLDLDENHVECHRGLAVLLVEMGRSEQAFTLLRRWEAANPDLADPKIELARLLQEHGNDDDALLHLHQAMYVGSPNSREHARAWAAAGLIRERRGELAQARQNFRQAYQLNRDQPGVATHVAHLERHMATGGFRTQDSGQTRVVQEPFNRNRY